MLAEIYCGLHKLDSARYFLTLARDEAVDLRDSAALNYLSFQIETADGNPTAAKTAIEKYIELSDSVSRLALYQSATAAERKVLQRTIGICRLQCCKSALMSES
ncbi:MAG: hypothetical protein ACLTZY_14130 [Alistipes indistinctus]